MRTTVQVRRRGTITLPNDLRRRYQVEEGDVFTLIELGEGSLLLTPRAPQVAPLGDRVAEALTQAGATPDDILRALEEEREAYYREHYEQP